MTATPSHKTVTRVNSSESFLKRNTGEPKKSKLLSPRAKDKPHIKNDGAQVGQGLLLVFDAAIGDTQVRTRSKTSRNVASPPAARSSTASTRREDQVSNTRNGRRLSPSKGQPSSKPSASDALPTAITNIGTLAAKKDEDNNTVPNSFLLGTRTHRGLIISPRARTATGRPTSVRSDPLVTSSQKTSDSAATGEQFDIASPKQAPRSKNLAGKALEMPNTLMKVGLIEKRAATASLAGRGNRVVKRPETSLEEKAEAGVTASRGAARCEPGLLMSSLEKPKNSPYSPPSVASRTPRSSTADDMRQVPSTMLAPRVPTTPRGGRMTRSPRRQNAREPKHAS